MCEPVLLDQVNEKLIIERSFAVPAHKVLDYLKTDGFQLSDDQTCPPVALLREVADRVRDTRSIGPALWTNAAFTKKLAPHLVVNSLRQSVVGGEQLTWFDGYQGYAAWARRVLIDLTGMQSRIFEAFTMLEDRYVFQRRTEVVGPVDLPEEDQRRLCLMEPRDGRNGLAHWVQLSDLEFEFVTVLRTLWSVLSQKVRDAVVEGRVVGVEETRIGERLMTQSELLDQAQPGRRTLQCRVLPTAMFRMSWLSDCLLDPHASKQAQIRHGSVITEEIYAWAQDNGCRFVKGDIEPFLVRHLGCSASVAREAWMAANCPEWKRSGAPKGYGSGKKLNLNDIINRGEVSLPLFDYFD